MFLTCLLLFELTTFVVQYNTLNTVVRVVDARRVGEEKDLDAFGFGRKTDGVSARSLMRAKSDRSRLYP